MTEPTPLTATTNTDTRVRSAIEQAARRTDVDFDYLLAQARLESGLRPNAKASTSSATGLFQFIESTWLATMKQHGPNMGFGDVAASIRQSGNRYFVADPTARRDILNLRKDPQIASLMAGALAQDNRTAIMPVLGREPQAPELYMAHFLGAGGARRFLSELHHDPSQSAPALFPKPAAANQSIFYQRDGSPRNLGEVMGLMQGKMNRAIAANGSLPMPSPIPAPWSDPQIKNPFGDQNIAGLSRPNARMITAQMSSVEGRFQSAANLPRLAMSFDGNLDRLPEPSNRPPMSELLRESFSLDRANHDGTSQVRRAYHSLKVFGL